MCSVQKTHSIIENIHLTVDYRPHNVWLGSESDSATAIKHKYHGEVAWGRIATLSRPPFQGKIFNKVVNSRFNKHCQETPTKVPI